MEENSGSLYLSKSVLISEWLRKHVDVNKNFLIYRNILDHCLSQGNSFEACLLRTFAKVFMDKVSLPKYLITIACVSLTLVLFFYSQTQIKMAAFPPETNKRKINYK